MQMLNLSNHIIPMVNILRIHSQVEERENEHDSMENYMITYITLRNGDCVEVDETLEEIRAILVNKT